jgi:hypothetical protein
MKDITDEKKLMQFYWQLRTSSGYCLVDKKIIYNLCKVSHVLRVKVNTLIGDTDWLTNITFNRTEHIFLNLTY